MRLFRAALLAPALLAMNACLYVDVGDFAHYSRDFHFNFPLNPGGHVSVEGFNGSIEITPWDQPTVDISGTKHARSESQVDTLKIDVDHTPDSVSIHASRQYDSHGNYGVRFAIKVPRGTALDRIVTSNGAIHTLEGIGPARFKSSNGAVRVEKFHGALDIQTSNGPIELDEVEGYRHRPQLKRPYSGGRASRISRRPNQQQRHQGRSRARGSRGARGNA